MRQSISKSANRPFVIDRRHVLTGAAALGGVVALAPGGPAQAQRGAEPTGQTEIVDLSQTNTIDVALLAPGQMVVARHGDAFYGILHRTEAQIAAAQASEGDRDPAADSDRVQVPAYLVADLACPHRGCQVGYSLDADQPFACPCHRSSFDAAGRVLGGPARANLTVPAYTVDGSLISFS